MKIDPKELASALEACSRSRPCTECSYETKCSMHHNQAMLDASDFISASNRTVDAVVGGMSTTHWYQCQGCRAVINVGDKFCHECGMKLHWQ